MEPDFRPAVFDIFQNQPRSIEKNLLCFGHGDTLLFILHHATTIVLGIICKLSVDRLILDQTLVFETLSSLDS
jgi:hypothetical protein